MDVDCLNGPLELVLEIRGHAGNDNFSLLKTPPLLPEEVLARTVRLARINGTSVLVIAGAFALANAANHDVMGAAIGLLVAASGAAEIHGAGMIAGGRPEGVRWLVGSQLYLLAVMIAYCGFRITHVDISEFQEAMTDDLKSQLQQAGLTVDQFLNTVYAVLYISVAVVTLFYQGLMARYYSRRRDAIERALSHDDGELRR